MGERRRYPIAPLIAATGWSMARIRDIAPCNGDEYRDRIERGVTERIADRLATAAGLHPLLLWPNWLDNATVPCAECGEPFFPCRRGHRYCSRRCGNRVLQRNRWRALYASDPGFREAERARRRAAYQECSTYEKARQRRYRESRREDPA